MNRLKKGQQIQLFGERLLHFPKNKIKVKQKETSLGKISHVVDKEILLQYEFKNCNLTLFDTPVVKLQSEVCENEYLKINRYLLEILEFPGE